VARYGVVARYGEGLFMAEHDSPTPNDMPGAEAVKAAAERAADAAPESVGTPDDGVPEQVSGLSDAERRELERLRAIHSDERKWENRNKELQRAVKEIARELGILDGDAEKFDPKSAITQLREEFHRERVERLRSEVARTEGVDLDVVVGESEDEMRAAAQRFKAKVDAAVEAALKARVAPAAAPASEVGSGNPIDEPRKLSREDLKSMSPAERIKAYREGLIAGLQDAS